MKTKHLWFALSALAIAGCSQNEITEMSPEANPAVGFSAYTGVQTRGVVTDLTLLKKDPATTDGTTKGGGFGILAYYTGTSDWSTKGSSTAPNFMYNQKVTWGSAWSYTPLKYWPNTDGEKISFFAYGPYDAPENFPTGTVAAIDNGIELSAVSATGAPTLAFTIKNAPNSMVDLVAAKATDQTKTSSAVTFQFKHLLSKVKLQAKLDEDISSPTTDGNTYVCITGISIKKSASSTGFYSKATYKWGDGTWDYGSSAATLNSGADYSLAEILPLVNHSTAGGDDLNGKGYTTESVVLKQDGTAKNLFKTANDYLFLIPPTDATDLAAGGGITSDKKVMLEIKYDIITLDDALSNSGEKFSKTSTTATVSLPEGTLKRGKAYNYIFTIGLEGIKVSVAEFNWDTEEEVNVVDAVLDADATSIKAAITALSTIKGSTTKTKFSVHVAGTASGTHRIDLSGMTTANFAAGDCITLDFGDVTFSSGSITVTGPAGWTVAGSSLSAAGQINLTKDS